MKTLLFFSMILLSICSCRKEPNVIPTHNIQFSCNINDTQYYDLTINGNKEADIQKNYSIEGSVDIELKIYAAGGDTVSINGKDSLWVTASIFVDGRVVKSYVGYRDGVLSYRVH